MNKIKSMPATSAAAFPGPRPFIIGLTGSLASGKSLVAGILEEAGAKIIDADVLARKVVVTGQPAFEAIVTHFGTQILGTDRELDRSKLAAIVFSDNAQRKRLEEIVHPEVRKALLNAIDGILRHPPHPPLIVCVIPLLFEAGYGHDTLDRIVTVSAPEEVCIQRAIERDKASREMASKRLNAQMPQLEKENRADIVIRNDGDITSLRAAVLELYQNLARKDPEQANTSPNQKL